MLGERVGSVARRGSLQISWRCAFIWLGENRAAIAFSDFCVARKRSIGAPIVPSELWRESMLEGCSTRGMAIIEQPTRLNSEAPAAVPWSSMSMTVQLNLLQSLMSLPSRSRLSVWNRSPKPACTSTSFLLRQKEKLNLRSSSS